MLLAVVARWILGLVSVRTTTRKKRVGELHVVLWPLSGFSVENYTFRECIRHVPCKSYQSLLRHLVVEGIEVNLCNQILLLFKTNCDNHHAPGPTIQPNARHIIKHHRLVWFQNMFENRKVIDATII